MKHILIFLPVLCVLCGSTFAGDAPVKPFKLWNEVKSPELKELHAPVAERFELPNGMILFLVEDHELPLIDLSMTLRVRDVYEPAEQIGLAEATASVMRSGGSAKYPGDKLDEILENMAAYMGVSIGTDSGSASLSTMKADFDKGLQIFVDVLRHPEFPDDKVDLYLTQARTSISKRNDNPQGIMMREFRKALYGPTHPLARTSEYATLSKIDRAALKAFHDTYFHPNAFIAGIVGDFKKDEMLAKIKAAFADWPASKEKLPDPPKISTDRKRRTFYIDRPQIAQTTFAMGQMIDMRRDNKDYAAIQMFNEVLSGGMAARLFTEVRTKKGLAYSVWGSANVPYDRPGSFSCSALTRNEQCLDSVEAVREEVVRIIDKGITEGELKEARESIINSFVFNFDTPAKIINRQMTYELFGYPTDFAERTLELIKKVTVEDVNRAAKKYIDPDKFVLLGVGNATGMDDAKTFRGLKDVQFVDVTIPMPRAEPMVIDPEREAKGKKILAECIQAAGGVDAFRGVTAVRADVVLTMKGMHLKGCMRANLPDNCRVDVAGPFGPISQVMAKDNAWKASGSSVQELKPAEAKKNLRTLIQSDFGLMQVLASGKEGYNVQALEPSREGDRSLIGVEIESASLGRFKIWFDAETKLIQKIRYAADGTQKEYDKTFSDHVNFGKMVLARTITDKDPAGPQQIEMIALQINPEVDAKLFERPEKATPPPVIKE